MKREFAEFLFKRIGTKLDDARHAADYDDINQQIDDVEVYFDTLKEIIVEVLKP